MAFIKVLRGSRAGNQFDITDEPMRIGRDSSCDIHFTDSETSRSHAEVEYRDGSYWIRDLGSSNGTFVNEQKASNHRLRSGDQIQIGKQLILFQNRRSRSDSLAGEVAIVPSSVEDASQIVGRLLVDASFNDRTAGWKQNVWGESGEPNDASPKPAKIDTEAEIGNLWEIMYRVSLEVSRTLDIDQLLNQILELIFQWVQCDRGCIMLIDNDSGELLPSCRKNRHSNAAHRLAISKTILEYVTKHGEGVLTSDAFDDSRWNTSASISVGGIREAICVPMKGRYGIVGTIYIDTTTSAGKYTSRTDRVFHEEHLKLLVAIGHQAALAIEDTHFYQNVVQAERLSVMGQTIASLSHHIKNIVQGLKGGSYLVEEGLKKNELETVQKGWRICGRNHERIEGLVVDMLTMSKDRTPVRQRVDLGAIIGDVVDLGRSRILERPTQIDWSGVEPPAYAWIDGDAIHKALLNLVGNAIDALKDKADGVVRVSLEKVLTPEGSEEWLIKVDDNGVGIPDADLSKIFLMFESNKGSQGTGLGLPVSLKIAQEHGGRLTVESRLGIGTTFNLSLPVIEEPSGPHDSGQTLSGIDPTPNPD